MIVPSANDVFDFSCKTIIYNDSFAAAAMRNRLDLDDDKDSFADAMDGLDLDDEPSESEELEVPPNTRAILEVHPLLHLSPDHIDVKGWHSQMSNKLGTFQSAVPSDGLCSLWAVIVSYVAQYGNWDVRVANTPLLDTVDLAETLVGLEISDEMSQIAELIKVVLEALLTKMQEGNNPILDVKWSHVSFELSEVKEAIDAMHKVSNGTRVYEIKGIAHLKVFSMLLGVDLHVLVPNGDYKEVFTVLEEPCDKQVCITLVSGHYEANTTVGSEILIREDIPVIHKMLERCKRDLSCPKKREAFAHYVDNIHTMVL